MNHQADARRGRVRIRGRIMRFTAHLLTGILIGCVADGDLGPQGTEPQGTEPQGTEPQVSEPQASGPQVSELTAEQPAPASNEPATASTKPDEPPTEIVTAPPVQLLGMSRADIIKHLGQPAFQRRDRTALLLRYREGRCILDLFLYPHGQSEIGKAVNYIEARGPDGQRIETRPCIDAVQKANAAG